MGKAVNRAKSADEALQALMRLCSRAERSSGDAMRLMRGWGVAEADMPKVLQRLVAERFIDDRRYTEFFVREKLNLSGWGAYKIRMSLRTKGISNEIIEEVARPMLEEVDVDARLVELMSRKMRTLKAKSPFDAKAKLVRFALSRGFEMDAVLRCASKVITGVDDEF